MNTAVKNNNDDDLAAAAQRGDTSATDELMRRYENMAHWIARTYFLPGADRDDMSQEARIGLFKAIRDYRPDYENNFKNFAALAITRQVVTAVKTATRKKHIPLNRAISLDAPLHQKDHDHSPTLAEHLPGIAINEPAIRMEGDALKAAIVSAIVDDAKLSDLECDVLLLYMQGLPYGDIARRLGRATKSVDNALQRLRKKTNIAIQARYIAFNQQPAQQQE